MNNFNNMDTVLVLNSDYSPLNVTTLKRGFVLVDKGKAEVLEKGVQDIITTVGNYVRPLIIRLLTYVKHQSRGLKVNRKRIYKRDGFTCAYCGTNKNLTLDHVLPKSRGGRNTWENMVTCCSRCNSKKDNRTPEEANMKLRFKPYKPSIFSVVVSENVESIWKEFQISLTKQIY